MYGLINKILMLAENREELLSILQKGSRGLPGCESYVVAADAEDASVIWITEVWESKDAHAKSLELPQVQAAMSKGRPLIMGFGDQVETAPVA